LIIGETTIRKGRVNTETTSHVLTKAFGFILLKSTNMFLAGPGLKVKGNMFSEDFWLFVEDSERGYLTQLQLIL
jgi:hypothetical protein